MTTYSGNIQSDWEDEKREARYKEEREGEFVCPICKQKAKEDEWHWGLEICQACFEDHKEEENYKHREQ